MKFHSEIEFSDKIYSKPYLYIFQYAVFWKEKLKKENHQEKYIYDNRNFIEFFFIFFNLSEKAFMFFSFVVFFYHWVLYLEKVYILISIFFLYLITIFSRMFQKLNSIQGKFFIYLLSNRRNFIPLLSIYFLTLDNTTANQIGIFT